MKTSELKSRLAQTAVAALALGFVMAGQTALACNADNWSTASGSPLASGPDGPDGKEAIARYSGFCAMQTGDGVVEYVEDQSPGGIDRIRARFYVFAGNSEFANIYTGLDGGSGQVFNVRFNTSGQVTLASNGQFTTSPDGVPGAWNSIEIDWNPGAGEQTIIVNGGTPVTEPIPVGDTVTSVRLGNLNGAPGTLNFDAYESRRTSEIGRLLACNANPSDEQVNILDALAVINEINEVELASGQPDCDEDGLVTILDALDIINIINS